eukprot:1914920-Pyramimonas_sp.AAC.1
MSCFAELGLHIEVSHSDNNLAPVGIIPYDRERTIPASPVVLRSCGTMVVDQVSFVVVVLTSDSPPSAQCTNGFGYCSSLCASFNAYPADHLFSGVIGRLCLPFMVQNMQ